MKHSLDTYNFKGKRALVRVDFNVPLHKETLAVTDDTRIRAAIPTIKKILNDGGSVILMSHLGRPLKKLKEDGSVDVKKHTLKNVIAVTEELLGSKIQFANDCIGEDAKHAAANLQPGQVLLLENLRFYKQEEKGEETFAHDLASMGDVYVNDAFGTAHRAHASTAIVAKYFPNDKLFGYVMANELANADKVLNNANKPFTAIMGGAKVSDKILIIEQLMHRVDNLIIGGAMAYTFAKAQGGQIGKSLCEDDKLELALQIIEKAKQKKVNLLLPIDSINAESFSNDVTTSTSPINQISENLMGLDIGPKTIAKFTDAIANSKTILWNGPMGVFEFSNFEAGTKAIGDAVCKATANGAFSLIGGGDSAAAVNQFGMTSKVSYVSTGGGALLEYMEGKELPGVKMILQ
ncbi:MAG: phosphoglycerate kinase [Bacteroidetes bacterium]|nr:phosphoglycerate kinase [Bacteroidota bacterium]